MIDVRGVGSQVIGWAVFGNEVMSALYSIRWGIVLCVVMVVTDFWWGYNENNMKYKEAVEKNDKPDMDKYRFRLSRAGRRTVNKFIDYLTYTLVGAILGLAILEPYGIATHVQTAAAGIGLGCLFDLSSIVGHICYVHNIKVSKNDIFGFLKNFIIKLVKKKSTDVGEALEETINENKDESK